MSTLKVTNIQSNAAGFNDVVSFQNSSGTQNATLCRAWVNFNGTSTVAIRANFNVSSITDNGTGDYTVNFTNAMTDANYATICGGASFNNASAHDGSVFSQDALATPSSSSVRVRSKQILSSAVDSLFSQVAIFR
jgi:hypothetical protein